MERYEGRGKVVAVEGINAIVTNKAMNMLLEFVV